jgi:HAE1 family hydrophobic/amphiphilic exporter-1
LKVKTFGRIILESYLTRFINWISGLLTWCLDHYKTTLAIVLVLFFSSIALVPQDLLVVVFAASDSGEF